MPRTARDALASGLVLVLLLLAGCGPPPPPRLTLARASFGEMPGWRQDDMTAALDAFRRSCPLILKPPPGTSLGIAGTVADWAAPCAAAAALDDKDANAVRAFFESRFTPWKAGNNGGNEGLFTGYYEAELNGSRQKEGPYLTPLLRRPADLVMVDLGLFRPAWRGERIAGRVVGGRLKPYDSRAEIEKGALARQHLAFLWVDDPVDAFFLQIQGSGRVRLPDGSMVQVGYDGQNGQPYVPIGRLLIERGALAKDDVSMQTIRAWIKANPAAGEALMTENPSYVFFREMSGDGPIGAEGAVLTPGRSLAVDRSFVPLGLPIFIAAGDGPDRLERLMVAQDTGGAIRGPVRGDVFWGFGPEAAARAGAMKIRGEYYLLLPKNLSVAAAAK